MKKKIGIVLSILAVFLAIIGFNDISSKTGEIAKWESEISEASDKKSLYQKEYDDDIELVYEAQDAIDHLQKVQNKSDIEKQLLSGLIIYKAEHERQSKELKKSITNMETEIRADQKIINDDKISIIVDTICIIVAGVMIVVGIILILVKNKNIASNENYEKKEREDL